MLPATGTVVGLAISSVIAIGALTLAIGIGDARFERSASSQEAELVDSSSLPSARRTWATPATIYVVGSEDEVRTVSDLDRPETAGRGSAFMPPKVAVVPRDISLAEMHGFNFQRASEGQTPYEIVDLR